MSAAIQPKGWCPGALRPMLSGDGYLVRLRISGGVVSAIAARAIADCAQRYGNGLLDLSARANLQLRGVQQESLAALVEALQALNAAGLKPAGDVLVTSTPSKRGNRDQDQTRPEPRNRP
jgi:precorrin-3B synthase